MLRRAVTRTRALPPRLPLVTHDGRARVDAAQGAAEDVPQDVAQNLAFGAWAARALLATPAPPPPCLCAARAEMGAQLGSDRQLSGIWLGLWASASRCAA